MLKDGNWAQSIFIVTIEPSLTIVIISVCKSCGQETGNNEVYYHENEIPQTKSKQRTLHFKLRIKKIVFLAVIQIRDFLLNLSEFDFVIYSGRAEWFRGGAEWFRGGGRSDLEGEGGMI